MSPDAEESKDPEAALLDPLGHGMHVGFHRLSDTPPQK